MIRKSSVASSDELIFESLTLLSILAAASASICFTIISGESLTEFSLLLLQKTYFARSLLSISPASRALRIVPVAAAELEGHAAKQIRADRFGVLRCVQGVHLREVDSAVFRAGRVLLERLQQALHRVAGDDAAIRRERGIGDGNDVHDGLSSHSIFASS